MTTIGKFARLLSGSACLIALTGPALAQAPAAPAAAAGDEEIVVTASRVARSGFSAPTPTTVLGQEAVQARGASNITEVINEIPAFRPSSTPASGARGGGSNGFSFLDLRGLNGQGGTAVARTLVLLDGRRVVPANGYGLVDINLIPSALIGRTEVVTGGASASWGSDAITGVVNLILKDKMQGIEGSLSYGQAEEGDYKEYNVNIAGGTEFAGGRGHIMAGLEYTDNSGIEDGLISRDWGKEGWLEVAYPNGTRPAGVPSRLILPDVRFSSQGAPGGVTISTNPLIDNYEFTGNPTPGQQLVRFTPGFEPTISTGAPASGMSGGGANNSNAGFNLNSGSNLVAPISRTSFFSRLNWDFTPDVTGFLEVSHAESQYKGFSAQRRDTAASAAAGGITATALNPFLPSDMAALMTSTGTTQIRVGRFAADDLRGYNNYDNETNTSVQRVAAGLRGNIFGDWNWDTYYQYGESNFVQHNQSTIVANYLSAVRAGGTLANPTCGALTPTEILAFGNAAPGCVAFNIFGRNAPSQAAVDYVLGVGTNDVTTRQNVAALNLSGDLFELPAGPVSFATGVEYRKEEVFSNVDANSQAKRFDLNNFQAIDGKYDTKEAYAETVVPIVKDVPFVNLLEFNAAARYTYYSSVGDVTTWKAGFTWEPIADIRFRATQSRDTRAPSINELSLTSAGRANVTQAGVQINSITIGNPNLSQEDADTRTFGVVFTPSWFQGFRTSLDYYKIEIDNVIGTVSVQDIVDRCQNRTVPENCNNITAAPLVVGNVVTFPNGISEVRTPQVNLSKRETSGVDGEISYAVPEDFVVPGQFEFRVLASYVEELVTIDPVGPIDRAEQTVPHWSGNFAINYGLGRFHSNATVRYIGQTVVDTTFYDPTYPGYSAAGAFSINDNVRPAYAYLNLSASYDLLAQDNGKQLQVFGVVNNVTDKDPPRGSAANAVGASLYDVVGRAYKVGLRFKY